jgi:hypothetical protein
MRNRSNENGTAAPQRPYASETAIREMHDKAAMHRNRAAGHEQAAAQVERNAADVTSQVVNEAKENAAAYVAKAQETAAEMVRQAKAQADADVAAAEEKAAAELQAAQGQAAVIRTERDAEVKSERYWSGLAAEEAEHAGLPSVRETLTDGQLDASGARDA